MIIEREESVPMLLENVDQSHFYFGWERCYLTLLLINVKTINDAWYDIVYFAIDRSIGEIEDVGHAFAEQKGTIDDPSQCQRYRWCHELLKLCLELRSHHEVGTSVTVTGGKLAYFILEGFNYFLIFDVLTLILGI